MTPLFSTTGFVLRRRAQKEADRVYTLFSRDLGKIDVLARGGRRLHSKLAPHLESFSEVRVFLVDGKAGYTLAGSDIEERFVSRGSAIQTALFTSARHVVDLVTRWHQEDRLLYDQLLGWMRFCHGVSDLHPARAGLLTSALGLRMVRHAGYAPELFCCLACRRELVPSTMLWSSSRGGVLCAVCATSDRGSWSKHRSVSTDALKLLRFIQGRTWGDLMKIELDSRVVEEVQVVIDGLILAHFPVIPSVPIGAMASVGQGW